MGDTPPDDDNTTTSATTPNQLLCPVCWTPFTRVRRQRFCSDNCRKTAWARTHQTIPRPTEPVPPPGHRRALTVYSCPSCQTRYHGQQWCPDCNQPCTRIGLGGLCPHCDEPVTLTDLFNTPQQPTMD